MHQALPFISQIFHEDTTKHPGIHTFSGITKLIQLDKLKNRTKINSFRIYFSSLSKPFVFPTKRLPSNLTIWSTPKDPSDFTTQHSSSTTIHHFIYNPNNDDSLSSSIPPPPPPPRKWHNKVENFLILYDSNPKRKYHYQPPSTISSISRSLLSSPHHPSYLSSSSSTSQPILFPNINQRYSLLTSTPRLF